MGSLGESLITLHRPPESVTNLKITLLDKFVTSWMLCQGPARDSNHIASKHPQTITDFCKFQNKSEQTQDSSYFDNGPLISSEAQKHFMILNRMFTVYYAQLDLSLSGLRQAGRARHSEQILEILFRQTIPGLGQGGTQTGSGKIIWRTN